MNQQEQKVVAAQAAFEYVKILLITGVRKSSLGSVQAVLQICLLTKLRR